MQGGGKSPKGQRKTRKEGLVVNWQKLNAPLDLVAMISRMAPPKSLESSGVQAGGRFKGILEFSA